MPQPPPLDGDGEVAPHNHAEIENTHLVIRRISEKQVITNSAGERRISSIAYKPSSGANGGMSVDIEPFITATGRDARAFVTTPIWTGSVFFAVGQLRADALLVGYHPIPGNDAHGEVWGARTKAQWKKLQAMAAWYVEIPGVGLA